MMDWMQVLRIALVLIGLDLFVYLLFGQLVDIYFEAKLKYESKLIGGLGQALKEAANKITKDTDDERKAD